MKKDLSGFAGKLLVAFNVFIVFLLVFENKIVIPYWLQPIGRMHPMIIHFSIVILILAMFLEFFRFKSEFNTQDLYHRFASNLLLVGVLSAAITVIMGIFLSREEGYSGVTLQWHKWSGVSIVLVSSVIYWSRNAEWYKPRVARSGAILTFFCLLLAGHYGATLSHGENYLLEPVLSQFKRTVPIEEALVFDDVVQPIFQEKCISCHNSSKLKGNLMLTNAKSVLKGGKTGKLYIPGKPELSLLLQRIHLPQGEKKHMPPKNEVQLSEDEAAILLY
ncbi:MAG TPA: cytochrome C, partial [Sphingobacteriaceae bacterium]|nr:cytochrome C [Sphingobacteriaceae bacterium]